MRDNGLWIPPKIWTNGGLSLVEKAILATVFSFQQNDLDFFQSNATISENIGVSPSTVKRAMHNLRSMGMLTQSSSFDGRKRKLCVPDGVQNDLSDGSKRPTSKVKKTRQKGQNEPAGGSKRPSINNLTKQPKNNVEKKGKKKQRKVLMPFDDFEQVWAEWTEYKWEQHRFKYNSEKSEQAALNYLQKLSNHDRQQAIEIIGFSIANGYKGLFAQRGSATKSQPNANEFAEYIKTGKV